MIELPESYVLSYQIEKTLVGKTIKSAVANSSPHSFAWFTDHKPEEYNNKLAGKTIIRTNAATGHSCGGKVEILCGDMLLVISTPIKYHESSLKIPKKHQLLLEFTDNTFMSCTVEMWGAMLCDKADNFTCPDGIIIKKCPSPLEIAFDEKYFDNLMYESPKIINYSAKAFLATDQRIPGLGNGVLQDILLLSGIHPKRKMATLSQSEKDDLFYVLKNTLQEMIDKGGRDTEKDLFGNYGGYQTLLSKKTINKPCRLCGGQLKKEPYMGGAIYYCTECQPLNKEKED